MFRAVIRGWQHTPNNGIYLCGKILNCYNWRTIEVDDEKHSVCDVDVGDPKDSLGGSTYEEIHVQVIKHANRNETPGLEVVGIGRDDR